MLHSMPSYIAYIYLDACFVNKGVVCLKNPYITCYFIAMGEGGGMSTRGECIAYEHLAIGAFYVFVTYV